jgi:hypothetical protein
VRHARECAERCATGCGVVAFEEWLNGPVLESDRLADERKEERLQALLRGEVPT